MAALPGGMGPFGYPGGRRARDRSVTPALQNHQRPGGTAKERKDEPSFVRRREATAGREQHYEGCVKGLSTEQTGAAKTPRPGAGLLILRSASVCADRG